MYEKMYKNSKHALINIEILLTLDSKKSFYFLYFSLS